jgi:hypothetical protein
MERRSGFCLATTGVWVWKPLKLKFSLVFYITKTKSTKQVNRITFCCLPFLFVIYGQELLISRALFPAYLHMICTPHMFRMKFHEFLITQKFMKRRQNVKDGSVGSLEFHQRFTDEIVYLGCISKLVSEYGLVLTVSKLKTEMYRRLM